jgi:CheY-like chemotaxis protein
MGRVLIVDDSRTARELHRRALEAAGFEVALARDGMDALVQLSLDSSIDLVVTDLEMDQMDGFMLTEAIKASRSSLPIVVVSSKGQDEIRERVIAAGADAYIVKRSFSWNLLVRTVERLLAGPRLLTGLSPAA